MAEAFEAGARGDVKKAAVVVPVYKEGLDADEEISYRHLVHFLGRYDKFAVAPESLKVDLPGFAVRRFRDEFFSGTATYSALLLSEEFYESFAQYDYILLYQLDALVFSDQLLEWCARGFDYVGAPWFEGEGNDFVRGAAVGNGGLSLRRVEAFLKVIRTPGFARELEKYRDAFVELLPLRLRLLHLPRKAVRRLRLFARRRQTIMGRARRPADPAERLNEDCFWSFKAASYDPDFRVAPVAEALRFAFEVAPERCFERNGRRLPFGCHAWNKYDRRFWEPYLLK